MAYKRKKVSESDIIAQNKIIERKKNYAKRQASRKDLMKMNDKDLVYAKTKGDAVARDIREVAMGGKDADVTDIVKGLSDERKAIKQANIDDKEIAKRRERYMEMKRNKSKGSLKDKSGKKAADRYGGENGYKAGGKGHNGSFKFRTAFQRKGYKAGE
jgi:hypothetical protein